MCLAHGLNPMKVYLLRETLSHSPSPCELGPPLESIPAVLTHPTRCRFDLPLVSPWKMVPSCTPSASSSSGWAPELLDILLPSRGGLTPDSASPHPGLSQTACRNQGGQMEASYTSSYTLS